MPPSGSNKKRKTDSGAIKTGESPLKPAPIIYSSPGLKPDVRLRVTQTEYHVHSVVLKLYSNYFRRFLDSPEKDGKPASAEFRYEYVAVFDKDGTLALEPRTEQNAAIKEDDLVALVISKTFPKLLSAMYNRPYKFDCVTEVLTLIKMADFYCALPILASSMSAALLKSTVLDKYDTEYPELTLAGTCESLLLQAKKLRNATLFRECFIHVVGRWDPQLEDEEIKQQSDIYMLVIKEHSRIYRMIADTLHRLLFRPGNTAIFDVKKLRCVDQEGPIINNPRAYRLLKSQVADYGEKTLRGGVSVSAHHTALLESLERLMVNNLVLSKTSSSSLPYFLCANIEDEDMPWDDERTDW